MAHRYFTTDITDGTARITGADAAHLARVLRTKPGQQLTLCDGDGTDYTAEVTTATPETVTLRVLESHACATEPSVWAEVFLAVGKGDKTDFAVQKSVELGASAIRPFYSEHSVAQPKNEAHKTGRFARIAAEAAKQSGRGVLPEVYPPCNFAAVLAAAAGYDSALLFDPSGTAPLADAVAGAARLALITGPEGGFSAAELDAALTAGCVLAGLGPRILRCETAPLAALAAVMTCTGNLG